MSEYLTYTIVVRDADDTIADLLQNSAEGICFLHVERGISAAADRAGAHPDEWDVDLSEVCAAIYERSGMTGVFDYIRKNHPDVAWSACEGCETDTPHVHIAQTDEDECLVCGLCKETA